MSDFKKVAEVTFTTPLIFEGSWGERDAGTHESTMTLYRYTDRAGRGFIEWDVPALETTETIGLWWECQDGGYVLTDYDGIMGYLPAQAAKLLEDNGFIVSKDFLDDEKEAK
jgi:hypothetical protein